jgi:hypothetical protein
MNPYILFKEQSVIHESLGHVNGYIKAIRYIKRSILMSCAERYTVRHIERYIRRGYSEATTTIEPLATADFTKLESNLLTEILKTKYKDLSIRSEPLENCLKPGGFKAWLKRPTQPFRLTAPTYSVPIFNVNWKG